MPKKYPKKRYKIRKHQLKKGIKKKNLGRNYKSDLISKTHNLWNPRSKFNQEAQLSTNLFLNDEIIYKKTTKRIIIEFNKKGA